MSFEVIPAIDLLDGQVVRLERGDTEKRTVYSDDAVAIAKQWEAQGAQRLHVVDLNGAMEGEPRQEELIEQVIKAVDIPVQVGGGVRRVLDVVRWEDVGADRVIIGTAAFRLIDKLDKALDVIIVALDVRDREVRVSGWREGTGEDVFEAVERLATRGASRFLVTDIRRDGMLAGPNLDLYGEIVAATTCSVIASGGVATIADLRALAGVPGVEGVIVGKALYAGTIELADALKAVA
jgi:phosphoribosylformimino-5-aminoimidazole carboxamide ribotide isomerase